MGVTHSLPTATLRAGQELPCALNPLDARGPLAFCPEAAQLRIGSHLSGAQYQGGVSAPRGEPQCGSEQLQNRILRAPAHQVG